ncbi:MAG: organic hydroperoxide reductase OsmC/OhrA [Bacteroidia bacterium]|jgi:organic hydroperoxide reductase OsmC/OhrA
MLWFLHLCADAGVVVVSYTDHPTGILTLGDPKGPSRFTEATLHPQIEVNGILTQTDLFDLHDQVHSKCFMANSVNFPVHCKPVTA